MSTRKKATIIIPVMCNTDVIGEESDKQIIKLLSSIVIKGTRIISIALSRKYRKIDQRKNIK